MLADVSANAIIYQVLDEVLGQKCVPPGRAQRYSQSSTSFAHATAGGEDVRRAERISVEMHKLEWALRLGDAAAKDAAHVRLRALAAEWISTRICSRH